MKLTELKSTLWDAANTLRGSAVDRTDRKGYILPLLFFKRISDVWDEETAEAAGKARRHGLQMVRTQPAGTHPLFVSMHAELVQERVRGARKRAAESRRSAPDACAPGCCSYTPPARPASPSSPPSS
jgi:hypothetical protein